MAVNPESIQEGMDVYDSKGDKIGTVESVSRTEAESGMASYREAAGANVGTTEASDAEEDGYRTADAPNFDEDAEPDRPTADAGAFGRPVSDLANRDDALGLGSDPGSTDVARGASVAPVELTNQVDFDDASATDSTMTGTDEGYMHIKTGGILGLGSKNLYVPFSAVDSVVPGENVTLNCAKEDCEHRFGHAPAGTR